METLKHNHERIEDLERENKHPELSLTVRNTIGSRPYSVEGWYYAGLSLPSC